MSAEHARPGAAARADALRREFDAAFSAPPPAPRRAETDFVCVTARGTRYALPLREIASVRARCVVTRLPGAAGALVGLAWIRGVVLAVHDLASLAGAPPDAGAAARPLPWLAVAAGSPVALAFDAFEAHVRVATEDVAVETAGAARRRVVRVDGAPVPVVDVGALLARIAAGSKDGTAGPGKGG